MTNHLEVFDIFPGSSSSSPSNLIAFNGNLFFSANDGTSGRELWKSDGTEAGTTLVADIRPGSGYFGSNPSNLTDVNGTLFFTANDGTNGVELWKSDGTTTGTTLVANIRQGSGYFNTSSNPSNLTDVNGTLFFTANNGVNGVELWKSDGTTAGTTLVADIFPGKSNYFPNSSEPSNLTDVNGTLFFTAKDGVNGTELWKSDGTTAGTILVADINPGTSNYYPYVPESSNPSNLTDVNGTLFFTANDGTTGVELWKSDGTTAGTTRVADINPGTSYFNSDSNPSNLTEVNGTLFFTANDGVNGVELWKSDGTTAGTTLVADINSGSASAFYDGFFGANPNLTNVNGTLFFTANDGINGIELWKSDGTEAGTTLVVDINPNGSSFSNYSDPNLTAIGNNLFFTADNGTSGNELFSLSLDPVANNDAVTIAQDSVTNINVLANDSDPDANFRISSFTEVTNNGRVTLNDNGTLTNFLDDFLVYTPNLNFSGRETFSYTISDTNGGISTATVSIEVGTNLSGSRGADNLIGTPGNDRIEGRRGADNIQGLDGDDTLIGGGGKDTLIGGAGNDSLSGGNGRDEIFGGSGDDTISGDKGNDLLTGSSGRDIFALAAGDGTDTIIDFTLGEDLIGLSGTLTFNDLSFAGNNILFGTETLATLSEVNTTTLSVSDFITV